VVMMVIVVSHGWRIAAIFRQCREAGTAGYSRETAAREDKALSP
jgi:hypothetical protein